MKYPIPLFIVFILNSFTSEAQSLSFQINSIGSNPNMTTGSLSFQVENIANCLFVANGLSIYKPVTESTKIDKGCEVPIQFDHYGLKIYPQPIGNSPRLQLTKEPQPNCPFTIRWYTMEGKLVLQETRTGFALSNGSIINTSKLFAGTYAVQVISENSLDIIQVIKQD
jgi:hypothetical protein